MSWRPRRGRLRTRRPACVASWCVVCVCGMHTTPTHPPTHPPKIKYFTCMYPQTHTPPPKNNTQAAAGSGSSGGGGGSTSIEELQAALRRAGQEVQAKRGLEAEVNIFFGWLCFSSNILYTYGWMFVIHKITQHHLYIKNIKKYVYKILYRSHPSPAASKRRWRGARSWREGRRAGRITRAWCGSWWGR